MAAAYLVTLLASARPAWPGMLLDPREAQLAAAVADLRRSRVELVDAFETERRRIERDLHDGVQQRLVALTMTLGRAEQDVAEGPGLDLVREAHGQAEPLSTTCAGRCAASTRGCWPTTGSPPRSTRSPTTLPPVAVDIRLEERPPPPLEAAAYFVASEALTNVARHAGARQARCTRGCTTAHWC